jgi:hypothetical protein
MIVLEFWTTWGITITEAPVAAVSLKATFQQSTPGFPLHQPWNTHSAFLSGLIQTPSWPHAVLVCPYVLNCWAYGDLQLSAFHLECNSRAFIGVADSSFSLSDLRPANVPNDVPDTSVGLHLSRKRGDTINLACAPFIGYTHLLSTYSMRFW